jgi:hypothetical protein
MAMDTPLQKELETFERLKPELLSEEGKFAVIFDGELIGVFAAYEDALKSGYAKCGVKPFLVKKILAIEPVNFFTRNFAVA